MDDLFLVFAFFKRSSVSLSPLLLSALPSSALAERGAEKGGSDASAKLYMPLATFSLSLPIYIYIYTYGISTYLAAELAIFCSLGNNIVPASLPPPPPPPLLIPHRWACLPNSKLS